MEKKGNEVNQNLDKIKHIIAVASGKGGVGKSTISTNLAISLAKEGYQTAILDADIYGPSIPQLLGTQNEQVLSDGEKIHPIEKFGIKSISIGNIVDSSKAAIWRGPMVHNVLKQITEIADFGELDFLILDLPPGTGDVQISLAHLLKIDGVLAVSTPQEMSVIDVKKCVDMFKKINIPVVGFVENMSYFVCDNCDKKHYLFGESALKKYAEEAGISILAKLPLNPQIMQSAEDSRPFSVGDETFADLADKLLEKLNY